MELIINLIASHGRLSSREPFLLADNEQLKIKLATDYAAVMLVSMRNGGASAKVTTNGEFEVPPEVLKGGSLEMVVTVYANGVIAKQWNVEPITIIEHNEGFESFPLIDSLTAKVEELTAKCTELVSIGEKWESVVTDCKKAQTLSTAAAKAVTELIKANE